MLTLKVSRVMRRAKLWPRFIEYGEITGLLGHIVTEAVVTSKNKPKQRTRDVPRERFEDASEHPNNKEV